MSTIPTLQTYLDLIPSPNNTQPKFIEWYQGCLQPFLNVQSLLASFNTAFSLDEAVGVQLDLIGQRLGQGRIVDFEPPGGLSPILDDETYRLVLRGKILKSHYNGTKQQIYDFWRQWFPQYGILIHDNQDMTVSVIISGITDDISQESIFAWGEEGPVFKGWGEGYWTGRLEGMTKSLIRNGYFVPNPSGVLINYSFSDVPLFGWDSETSAIKGWGEGYWIGPNPGSSPIVTLEGQLDFSTEDNSGLEPLL